MKEMGGALLSLTVHFESIVEGREAPPILFTKFSRPTINSDGIQ